jgi:hypothetical protein
VIGHVRSSPRGRHRLREAGKNWFTTESEMGRRVETQ